MSIKRVLTALLLATCLASGLMAVNVSARMEARWALQAGDVLAGEDISVQHPTSALFHQQTGSASDFENFNIKFPGELDLDSKDSPVQGVDLAVPDITQTADQTIDDSSTGYFHANWAYISDVSKSNLGASPLGLNYMPERPFQSPGMLGSGLLWPMMTPLPGMG